MRAVLRGRDQDLQRGDGACQRKKIEALAELLAEHHDALEADFAECYGIDLERAFERHSVRHIAVLAVRLPYTSRTNRELDGDCEWGMEHTLLAAVYNVLAGIQYGLAGKKGAKKPKLIGPSYMVGKKNERKLKAVVMPIDDLREKLQWFDEQAGVNDG